MGPDPRSTLLLQEKIVIQLCSVLSSIQFPSEEASAEGGCPAEGQPAWVNALVGRIFWDFLREKYWVDLVAHKIQKKLSKIRVSLGVGEGDGAWWVYELMSRWVGGGVGGWMGSWVSG